MPSSAGAQEEVDEVPAAATVEVQKVPVVQKDYRIEPTTEAIKIDGVLDEAVWQTAQPMEFDAETNPGENIPPPVRTIGYMTFDSNNLYVAFRAYDPDPSAIRAHLSDRDNAFSDDFIGVVLDTFNDQRRAFEFFVNPLGVQMDLIQDDVNRNEDASWDAIWTSAGRITPEGYIVEMAIPFTSLRFPSSDSEQTWGVDMVRIYPRSVRHRIGLQGQDRNRNCYLCQSSRVTGFRGISPGRDIELDPTLTAQQTSVRTSFPNGRLDSGDTDIEAGLTARWGITPNLTLNAAINPDFSQIEADAVQLDINTQFTLFFNEKRPFFLEGSDFFQGPLQAVYTRTVADPEFGLKLTGRLGDSTIGAYIARDAVTNLILPGPEGSASTSLDLKNTSSVFRYRYNVGETSSVGAILTSRDATDYSNLVYGIDGNFRVTPKDTISGQILGSNTEYPSFLNAAQGKPEGGFDDLAGMIRYRHNSRNWFWGATYEDIGTDFRADSGFIPQVGYRLGNAVVEYNGWGEQGKTWYTRWFVGGDYDRAEKQDGELLEEELEGWAGVSGPMQSFALIVVGDRDRRFNDITFDEQFFHWHGEFRPLADLFVYFRGTFADQIDFANTRPGERFVVGGGVRWNIGLRTRIDIDRTYEDLDVAGGRLFAADVTALKAIYHFNIRTFARVILQHTDITRTPTLYLHQTVSPHSERLFPQLLFSYTLNPQTVFFAGYSGTALGGSFEGIDTGLTEADRTFFMKIGYAWLF
ncbi:MAG TPA: DUF5916 domain-containing protein [Thermoanaerobaculia bacterium]|nr:DUF5916 domain-containing protein [Thermoanaerobaculia bacterium]